VPDPFPDLVQAIADRVDLLGRRSQRLAKRRVTT
jgi:hypothetical protein